MNDANVCIVVARPRSGTTALGDILGTHREVVRFQELLRADHSNDRAFFYKFLEDVRPSLLYPSIENRKKLFNLYINHLRELEPNAHTLMFHINYNSLHTFNAIWQHLFDPPMVLNLIRQSGFRTIHLVRRNILATLISEMRARESGVWHIKAGEDAPDAFIRIKPAKLLRSLDRLETEVRMVSSWMRGLQRNLQLYYEDLFEGDGLTPEALASIASFLDVSADGFENATSFRRTGGRPLAEVLANHADVVRVIRKSRFSKYLDGF